MTEIESKTTSEIDEATAPIDPIKPIYEAECPSLSGRSVLTYAIGRHSKDQTLSLAITANSGGGMWCKDWASAEAIQDVVLSSSELTGLSFQVLHTGRSINTGSFIAAALKDLGLIRVNEDTSRLHEHVPFSTFEQAVMARIAGQSTTQPVAAKRRKPKDS